MPALLRAAPLAVLVALALAAPAAAFGPPAFQVAPGGAPAACLQRAGDRVAYVAGYNGTPEVRFLGASPTAHVLQPVGEPLRLGPMLFCPAVATAPSGSTEAAAGWVGSADRMVLRAVVRDGGPPVTLARSEARGFDPTPVAVAAGDAGDVVVAWPQLRGPEDALRVRIHVARWRAGAGFGPIEQLGGTFRLPEVRAIRLVAGVDAAGAAVVAWVRDVRGNAVNRVAVATAPRRDAPFEGPVPITGTAPLLSDPAVAVAPSGTALLAYGTDRGLAVHERAGAAQAFGPPMTVGEGDAGAPAVALARDGGGAVVAWRTGAEGSVDQGIVLAVRRAAGPFAEAQRLALGAARPVEQPNEIEELLGFLEALGGLATTFGTLLDQGPAPPELALAPDGRFTAAWLGLGCPCVPGDLGLVPRATAGSLERGADPAVGLGSRLRSADQVATYVAEGEPGVAWSDNDGGWVGGGFEAPWRAGRIGATSSSPAAGLATAAAPPALTVRAPPQRVPRWGTLRLPVTCDAACDVRGAVRSGGRPIAVGAAALGRAGTTVLRITLAPANVLPRRPLVVVRAAARAGGGVTTRRVRVTVGRRPIPAAPRVLGLTARREGDEVVASWRTSSPVVAAVVVAGFERSQDDGVAIPSRDRTRFSVRLLAPPGGARRRLYVTILPLGPKDLRQASVVVP